MIESRKGIRAGIAAMVLSWSSSVVAAPTLPYTDRTQPFNARGRTALGGDVRTIGMAGTAVALPDSLLGATVNPAGLAMTMQGGIALTTQTTADGTVQDFGQPVSTTQFLMGFNRYPVAFGFSILTPYKERATYELMGSGEEVIPEVKVQQFNFSGAGVFWRNRIAVGASLGISRGIRQLSWPNGEFEDSRSVTLAPTASLGVMVQLPRRWLLGGAFHFGSLNPNELDRPSFGITNFFQEIYSAPMAAGGVSWIPNRFFRAAIELYFSGSNRDAFLVRSNSDSVNLRWLPQIRLGANYTWLDFDWIESNVYAGTYLESRPVTGELARIHGTAAVKFRVWVMTVGAGLDVAREFEHFTFAVGVDVNRAMEFLELVPRLWRPSPEGWFPNPLRLSEEGLPRPLVKRWKNRKTGFDVFRDGPKLPERIKRSYEKRRKELEKMSDQVGEVLDPTGNKAAEERARKRKRKRRKKR